MSTPINPYVLAGVVCLVPILAAVPLTMSDYWLSLAINAISSILLATAWRMFSGPTRYVSLAIAAFFGIGAYAVAIFGETLPFYLVLLIAGLAGAAVAFLVGLTTLRVSGVHFVIFTFGLSELVREVATWWEINQTRTVGRYVFVEFGSAAIYWHLLGLTAILFAVCHTLETSRAGFALRVIGEDEVVADQVGIDRARIKVGVFVLSAVFIALTGALMAPRWSYINPSIAFGAGLSFQIVIMALLGGLQRVWGPLLGVIPLTLLTEILSTSYPLVHSIMLGVIFLVSVYFLPRGIAGLLEDAWSRRAKRGAASDVAAAAKGTPS